MRNIVAFVLIVALTFVSGTSLAAAMCVHQDADAHHAALSGADHQEAAAAHAEEAAAATAAKHKALADPGSFSLAAFILPAATNIATCDGAEPLGPLWPDSEPLTAAAIKPLLEPPTA